MNPVRAPKFFELTTRYGGGENRLTAALAAVLAQVPELALDLARDWTDPHERNCAPGEVAAIETAAANEALGRLHNEDGGLLEIRTQVTSKQKHVDLEFRFGPGPTKSPDDVLIWLEAKAGSQPYPDQLAGYRDRLREHTALGAVILLAPRPDLPYSEELVPSDVPQRSWQAATPRLRGLRAIANDPVRFLVNELDAYMTDKNLTLPEAIGPEHLVAMAYWNQAEEALVAICEETSRFIKQTSWGQPDQVALDRKRPFYGWGYWEAWTRSGQRGSGEWLRLDWAVINDPSHPEVDGRSLAFVSGLAADDPGGLTATADDLERCQRLEAGITLAGELVRFERFADPDGAARLARVALPEEVLHGRTLEDQARSLGRWVVTGLDALSCPLDELVANEVDEPKDI